jgi:hypothetical protein
MDPATELERPAKRVKRDDAESPSPNSRENEDNDMEESGVVSDNNNAHRSDLYLDTV